MQTEPLLPCPFCGKSAATIWELSEMHTSIECYDGDGGCMAEIARNTEADAITAWNTRTPDPKAQRLADALGQAIELVDSLNDFINDLSGRPSFAAKMEQEKYRAALAEWKP